MCIYIYCIINYHAYHHRYDYSYVGVHSTVHWYTSYMFLVYIPVHTHIIHLIRCVHGSSKTSAIAVTLRLFNLSNRLSAVTPFLL